MNEDLKLAASNWVERRMRDQERLGFIGIQESNETFSSVIADAGRQKVNVTLEDGTITQATCTKVTPRAGTPVILKRVRGVYVVDRVREDTSADYAGDAGVSFDVGLHHHLRGSGLEYLHEAELFAPGCVYPNVDIGGLYIVVNPIAYFYGGDYKITDEAGIDLSAYVPGTSGQKAPVVVCVNPETNTIEVVSGTPVSVALPEFIRADYDAIDYEALIPLMGISLKNGQTAITDYRRDFISLTPWVTKIPRTNYSATTAPTTGDDSADGYAVGSLWIDVTNDNVYLCLDATIGAAVWDQLNGTGGGGMTSFTAAGDTGTPQTISDGETLTIAGGTGLSSVASATRTVTLNLDNTAVTPGSYNSPNITVDAQGRITAATAVTLRYQTARANDTSQTQRSAFNLRDGTGIDVVATDDSVNNETEFQFNMDINGLTEEATVENGDYFPFLDVSANAIRKAQASAIPGGGGGGGSLNVSTATLQTRTVLYDNTLAAAGSWDVLSISQDYDYLEIDLWVRGNALSDNDAVYMYFNNDTTVTNYRSGAASGGSTPSNPLFDAPRIGTSTAASSTADDFAPIRIIIPEYTSAQRKQAYSISGLRRSATVIQFISVSMNWENTSAINRITVVTDNNPTDQFVTNSRMTIIGVREQSVVTAVSGGLQGAEYSTDNVSNPPTDAEIDTAFGTPATVGAGYAGIINDAGAGTNLWFCMSDGSNWWYNSMTKAL